MSAYHIQRIRENCPGAAVHLTGMKLESIMLHIVQRGWVSLVMDRVARAHITPGTHIVRLRDPYSLTLCAIVRSGETEPAVQRLLDFLRLWFSDEP